ncbi:MAG TPA: hypothetical protein VGL09_16165 [Methylomirabilota bacterium]
MALVASHRAGSREQQWTSLPWPDGKRFAFTIFDDPERQTVASGRLVYSLLTDLGFRTTRGVWPLSPVRPPNTGGETCGNPLYVAHNVELQRAGFEVGYHNATLHSATRAETVEAIHRFHGYFGHYPISMTNHRNEEAIYWGVARLTGWRRFAYSLATRRRPERSHFGHVRGHHAFWGDVCRSTIRYCRNFVYPDINTLRVCPWMPYHDPRRPYVRTWFASSEGGDLRTFVETISERNQDLLEAEGGACIMYTHFGMGFVQHGQLDPRFRSLMRRLGKKKGWFVPVERCSTGSPSGAST